MERNTIFNMSVKDQIGRLLPVGDLNRLLHGSAWASLSLIFGFLPYRLTSDAHSYLDVRPEYESRTHSDFFSKFVSSLCRL